MVKLKEFVSIISDQNNKDINIISLDKIYKISNANSKFIKKLKLGILTSTDINENLSFFNFLQSKNLIMQNFHYPNSNYINNLYYYEGYCNNPLLLDSSFQNYSIGVIGCGGVGSVILDQIIALNIKNLKIIDFDTVQSDNLNRQFIFTENNIQQNKTFLTKSYLLKKNKNLKIKSYNKKITCEKDLEILKDVNLIINAADTPYNLNDLIMKFCHKNKIDFLTCGVGITSGHIGPLIPFSQKKYTFIKNIKNNLKKNLSPTKGSLGITNSLISSIMMNEFFKFKATGTCLCLNKIIFFNFTNYQTDIFNLEIYKEIDNEKN